MFDFLWIVEREFAILHKTTCSLTAQFSGKKQKNQNSKLGVPGDTNTPFPRLLISCKEHTSIKTLKSMSMRILKSRLFVGVVSFFLGALLVFHGVERKNTASCSRAPVSDLNTTLATFGHYIEHYNDERYLGKQDTFDPPARKPGYTYRSTTYQAVYDKTWFLVPKKLCLG